MPQRPLCKSRGLGVDLKPADKKAKLADHVNNSEVSNKTIMDAMLSLEKRLDEKLTDLRT